MKAAILFSSVLLTSAVLAPSTYAGEASVITFDGDSCNVEFNSDIRIDPQSLEIRNEDDHRMVFEGGNLYIDGELLTLTGEQKASLQNYSDGLRSQLPEVANIALEGVKIAGVAINEVTQAFGITDSVAITDLMETLNGEVEQAFYQQGSFVIGRQRFEEFENHFDDKLESEIEEAMKSAMMESIGSILMAIGSEMIGSGGDMDEFEQRMENMGKQIEEKVELQAQQLEQRADQLCQSFAMLAADEAKLHSQVPELAAYKLFDMKD